MQLEFLIAPSFFVACLRTLLIFSPIFCHTCVWRKVSNQLKQRRPIIHTSFCSGCHKRKLQVMYIYVAAAYIEILLTANFYPSRVMASI